MELAMEALISSPPTAPPRSPKISPRTHASLPKKIKFPNNTSTFWKKKDSFSTLTCSSTSSLFNPSPSVSSTSSSAESSNRRHWVVAVEPPPSEQPISKSDIVDYYVGILEGVLGSEKDGQMCIYDASFANNFGFCCDIDEETSRELSCSPRVLSVKPDLDFDSVKDYNYSKVKSLPLSSSYNGSHQLFPAGNCNRWLVRMEKPVFEIITKAELVDYYVQTLSKVLGNEQEAQVRIYHIYWQSNFGFCCELDDDCARELGGVPGVLSIQPDDNAEYGGEQSSSADDSSATNQRIIKTKKLFVTGLSFYTSEKTLRAAFEGFGELVEVKVIMDKISKRSKGYAFVEYTTEEAASAALREMNDKIINGWMITVDVARTNPPKYSRGKPRPTQ